MRDSKVNIGNKQHWRSSAQTMWRTGGGGKMKR